MFDLEKFKTGEYYVHLPTKELYDDVMEFLEKNKLLWLDGDDPTSDNRWFENRKQTCIRYGKKKSPFSSSRKRGLVYSSLDYYKENGYKRLEINKVVKGEINMNEKIKRDLIKMLFEKEFYSHEIDRLREYKGRIIFDYFHRSAKFIDFIDKLNEEYKIKGHEVAEIIIDEFDLEEYREEE